jgi:hypothetical protein
MLLEDHLIARFGRQRRFWQARTAAKRLGFLFARRRFGTAFSFQEAKAKFTALPYLLRNALIPIAIALALVVLMDVFNEDVQAVTRSWGWPAIDPNAYDALFETIAAVTGVFLALYFTAVSNVAASVYVNVPHDIRALIVRDKLGNLYVTGVAFTMAISVLLVVAHALAGRMYTLGPVVGALLAAFSIFAFIRLGQRAFYLADPTRLADTLASDFASWFRRARVDGWKPDDRSFQEHYRRQARQSTDSLASLLAIAGDQPHLRGGSVRQLVRSVVRVLFHYLSLRNQVPSESKWFGERYEHKQWYLAEGTELDMATETNTMLSPNAVPDVTWVEDGLLAAIVELVDKDLGARDYEDAYMTVAALEPIWERLGRGWSVKDGIRWLNVMTERATAKFSESPAPPLTERPGSVPAFWDALAMLPMTLELGFHRDIADRPIAELRKTIEEADWDNAATPYGLGLPQMVVSELALVQRGRAFEKAVAAPPETRTPGWYARERAFYAYERAFREQVEALLDMLVTWFPSTAKSLHEKGLPDAAGAVVSRGFETVWKLERHAAEWQQVFEELRQEPLLVDFVRLPWEWDPVHKKIGSLRSALLRQFAVSVPAQAIRQRDPAVPDYLGEAIHRISWGCFDALRENDADLFKELFPTFLVGVLAIVDRIRPQVQEWQPSLAATAMSEPMTDALELSGHALIYSELHRNPALWEACEQPWRRLLEGDEGTARLQALALMHRHEQNLFGITPRSTGRTRWQMTLEQQLSELPRSRSSHPFRSGEVEHESPLIRRLAPEGDLGGMHYKVSEVFVVRFLEELPNAAGLDFDIRDWMGGELRGDLDDEEPDD